MADQKRNFKNKTLCIFDLDNTLLNSFDMWCEITDEALERYAASRQVLKKHVEAEVKSARLSVRFGDIDGIMDWLDRIFLDPHLSPAALQQTIKDSLAISEHWHNEQMRLAVFYPDTIETLKKIKASGTKIVIQTNAQRSKVERRLWCLAVNAHKQDPDFKTPLDVLKLFDAVYTKNDVSIFFLQRFAEKTADEKLFIKTLDEKLIALQTTLVKPSAQGTNMILKAMSTAPQNCLFIGDHTDDALAARDAGIDYVFAKYGTKLKPFTLAMDKRIGDQLYPIGEDVIENAFAKLGVKPSLTLNNSLAELVNSTSPFTFGKQNPPKRPQRQNTPKPKI